MTKQPDPQTTDLYGCEDEKLSPAWCIAEINKFFKFLLDHGKCSEWDARNKRDVMPITISSSGASGIGRSMYAKCNRCGAEEDITHYQHW